MKVEMITMIEGSWSNLAKIGTNWPVQTNEHPNVPLLRKEVEWLESAEEYHHGEVEQFKKDTWNQEDWVAVFYKDRDRSVPVDQQQIEENICGTACCIAGNVAVSQGTLCMAPGTAHPWGVKDDAGVYWHYGAFAAEQLGLIESEQSMFAGGNTASDIKSYAAQAAARVGETL